MATVDATARSNVQRGRISAFAVVACALAATLLVGCNGDIVGLEDTRTPLATLQVRLATGTDISDLQHPRVSLVWGGQAIVETFCWAALIDFDPKEQAVAQAGCRDPLGFFPANVGVSAPVHSDGTAQLELFDLPPASVMVGEITGRVAYASVVLYDDLDDDGSLQLRWPHWHDGRDQNGPTDGEASPGGEGGPKGGGGDGGEENFGPIPESRTIHGASFVTMAAPDTRVAFREGTFDANSAFYPRVGCAAPPAGYSVLRADGFSPLAVVTSLPAFPPTTGCATAAIDGAEITLSRAASTTVDDAGCSLGNSASSTGSARYREPPEEANWLKTLPWVCRTASGAGLGGLFGPGAGRGSEGKPGDGGEAKPGDGGEAKPVADVEELVVAYPSSSCSALRHYSLVGCRNDLMCASPDWDIRAHPPAWWPCKGGSECK